MRTAELRRNLWLELSPQRVVALPLIVLIVVLMQQAVGSGFVQLATIGSWFYFAMVLLWGSRRAAAAVSEEVNGGTWTGQRLSALSPSSLVLGKLFGATAFTWYGGIIGLGIYTYALFGFGIPRAWIATILLQHLAWGLFVHCVAFAAALVLLNKRRMVERVSTTLPHILGLLVALAGAGLFWGNPLRIGFFLQDASLPWYSLRIDPGLFVSVVAVAFAGWGLLASVRLMAVQLQRQPLPWAWPAFSLFVIGFVQGFASDANGGSSNLWPVPALVALLLFYLALFADRNEPLRFRHCLAAFGGGQLRRGLSLVPWWAFGWLILLATALWPTGLDEAGRGLLGELARRFDVAAVDPLLARLGFAAFALRDAVFVLWMNAGRRSQRGDLVAFIYLLVLYGPVLVLLLTMEAWMVAGLISPLPFGPAGLGIASALVQAAVLAVLTWRRWQALFRS